jgi:phosphohistidine phosphatase
MGLRLVLVRHAKSSWRDPVAKDVERTLNARGRGDAINVGMWLNAQSYVPDQALVSAAIRTKETFALMQRSGSMRIDTTISNALYLASSDQILCHLRQAHGKTVIVIAHNPGIGDFANRLAVCPAQHPDFARYPTCATTVFDIAADYWRDVKFGTNTITDFYIPKDLKNLHST